MDIKDFSIPQTPGCYLFKDDKDQIIYVGKSKYLPKRVTSYFQKNHKDKKTLKLVTEIKNVDFLSTETENEALVLEEDLIKLYKPKFNIKGKDSRTIRSKLILTDGDWKKIELFYPHEKVEGSILAEFTSGKVANEVLQLIYDTFNLRSCSYEITEENVEKQKFKKCLEWHLGRCSAPCVGLASKIDYMHSIKLIKFEQPRRLRGMSKNNLYSLYDIGILGIISHSLLPIRMATFLGFLLGFLSIILSIFFLLAKLIWWNAFPIGIAPILIVVLGMFGVVLLFIGILGEYIGVIHGRIQNRPIVVEKERINF
jgi:hypothetical protein